MPRTPSHLKRLPDVTLTLSADQCRAVLAALCDVARRERERAAELDRPGCFACAEALKGKRLFAEECEQAGDAIRAALGDRRESGDGHPERIS